MAFTKKNYTSGQTIITADNLNNIQNEIINIDSNLDTTNNKITEINSDITDLQSQITSVHNTCWATSGTVASQYQKEVQPCSVTIPADSKSRLYLALGFADLSASNSNIMNCSLGGENITVVIGTTTRTTALSGGGCMCWMVFRNTPGVAAKVIVKSYGYNNSTYNITGKVTVIRLS